jgi:hypothetical protein
MAQPLTRGQKMLNQRFLAEHCVDEGRARQIWEDLSRENEQDMGGSTLEDTLTSCNKQLAFVGLEIVSVSMRDDENKKTAVKHFAIINKYPDEISMKAFEGLFHPQQHAFVRVLIAKLVDGPSKRSALLNARLDQDHEGDSVKSSSLALSAAEQVLDTLEAEKWIHLTKHSGVSALAPRAYAELSYLLHEEFGIDTDELPQQIFYR